MKNTIRKIVGLAVIMLAFLTFNAVSGHPVESLTDQIPQMAFAAVAKNELAVKELNKHFRHLDRPWMGRIPSKNNWVNNDVIKLNEIGADPEVLINNNTYPIAVAARPDESTVISLFKYDTTNTVVTDDEIYALPYDKIGSVQMQHRETLEEQTADHGLHSLAPYENTATSPIIETTGETVDGRKRMVYADLDNLKKKLNKLKVPLKGRVLVLSTDHASDLCIEDKDLRNQLANHKEGTPPPRMAGFDLYEDVYAPKYDGSTQKIAFNSVTEGKEASVYFYAPRTAKAKGSVKRYARLAENDPENRETTMGFRLYNIVIPTHNTSNGAIISADA
mgnify:CR=1 FL=1|tara:strand:- start:19 stop:1020 length:1002 start_codon:yes stop_codon:yes gene_type:complete